MMKNIKTRAFTVKLVMTLDSLDSLHNFLGLQERKFCLHITENKNSRIFLLYKFRHVSNVKPTTYFYCQISLIFSIP